MKKLLVLGAGGFIGSHLVRHLKRNPDNYVVGADIKKPLYGFDTHADEFHVMDLTNFDDCRKIIDSTVDEIYQLAADMGGAGYVFTGDNDANIMHNSVSINLNVLKCMELAKVKKVLYTSSACIYPEHNQMDPDNPICSEESAYPANPDSEYGWEKLFSERLYKAFEKNRGFDVRIARLHNVFGPYGSWDNGKEKAPAALCRKVAQTPDGGEIEVWGPGNQTRSFLYVDECVEGFERIMAGSYTDPINLGSARMISINGLVDLIAGIAGKDIKIKNIPGPVGVNGRTSDNTLISEVLGWEPEDNLEHGITQTLEWITEQINSI
jgi:GDP-D-mannose 3', 5'-epimerase